MKQLWILKKKTYLKKKILKNKKVYILFINITFFE